jgi:glycosyltransferase involved in cell wall biosynthesis
LIQLQYTIDVVIPAYNAGAFITQTLQSLLLQDMPINSVIVVNDGSIDDTQAKVYAFQEQNPQLKIVLIHQDNAGLSTARNAGIRQSKADYIALLDADDLWHPRKLSCQIALFQKSQNPQLGVVYCAYELIDATGTLLPTKAQTLITPKLRGNVYRPLLRGNFISGSGSSVLIARTVFEQVGLFDQQLKACEDWDMWLRIAQHYQFDYVDQTLVSIRVHPHNMQKDLGRMVSAELMVLNKFYERGEKNSFLLWKLRTYLSNKQIAAYSIAGFSACSPNLQAALSGWRMGVASLALIPLRSLANWYLKTQ